MNQLSNSIFKKLLLNNVLKHEFSRCISKTNPNFQVIPRQRLRQNSKSKNIGSFGWLLLAVPAATFALGTWQIQRKKWKEDLIRELRERVDTVPINLPETLDDIQKLEYYPVHVQGHFIHEKEIYMGPRTLLDKGDATTSSSLMSRDQNKTQGYLVITPFKLADRNETILVNRGWIPAKYKDPRTRPKGQTEGLTHVIGIVRLHENRPNFMPANQAHNNAWFYRDLEEMSAITGASPIFIDATKDFETPDGPISGQTRISLRNEHFSYVLTWYSLCGITSYMWYKQFIKAK